MSALSQYKESLKITQKCAIIGKDVAYFVLI